MLQTTQIFSSHLQYVNNNIKEVMKSLTAAAGGPAGAAAPTDAASWRAWERHNFKKVDKTKLRVNQKCINREVVISLLGVYGVAYAGGQGAEGE